MKLKTTILVLLALLTLAACGGAGGGGNGYYQSSAPAPTMVFGAATAAPAATTAPAMPAASEPGAYGINSEVRPQSGTQQNTQSQQNPGDRLVIKNAQLSIEVAKVSEAEALVRAKVQELGGYIVQTQTYGADNNATVTITFRVPSAQFDNALNGVQGIATKVTARSMGGEDVTEEFVDLDSRLRNLEATRTRLLDLLQKATKVEDALQVNQALTDVQGQIEQIQGRMKYLKQSAAMSTITVSIAPTPTTPIVSEDGWRPDQVARRALRSLLEFGQGLAEFLIVLLVWSPVWLLALFLWRWVWPKLRRAADRPIRSAAAHTPEEKQ